MAIICPCIIASIIHRSPWRPSIPLWEQKHFAHLCKIKSKPTHEIATNGQATHGGSLADGHFLHISRNPMCLLCKGLITNVLSSFLNQTWNSAEGCRGGAQADFTDWVLLYRAFQLLYLKIQSQKIILPLVTLAFSHKVPHHWLQVSYLYTIHGVLAFRQTIHNSLQLKVYVFTASGTSSQGKFYILNLILKPE